MGAGAAAGVFREEPDAQLPHEQGEQAEGEPAAHVRRLAWWALGTHVRSWCLVGQGEWVPRFAAMEGAGFRPVGDPCWERGGRTFEDLEGYGVVVVKGAWKK